MTEFQSAAEKLEFKKILGRLQSYASSDLGKNCRGARSPNCKLKPVWLKS